MQRRKKAEECVQQLQSQATEAWNGCILLMQEVGDMQETAQHENSAICMPSSFTSYTVRHYTETRATLAQLFDIAFCSMHLPSVHGENEFAELRRILLTISQQFTKWKKGRTRRSRRKRWMRMS